MSVPNEKTEFFSLLHLSDRSLWGLVVLFSCVTLLTVADNGKDPISTLFHTTYSPCLLRTVYVLLANDIGNAGFDFKEKNIHRTALI